MSNFWKAVEQVKDNIVEQDFRLYYDKNTGQPICLTCENLKGTYLQVTKEEYNTLRLEYVRVVDGKVKYKKLSNNQELKLVKQRGGKFKTIKDDVMFVCDSSTVDFDEYDYKVINDEE